MSSGPSTTIPQARLALKPDGPTTGFVDGGWWPRSRKLEDELPALVAALTDRLGPVEAVSFHLGEWDTPPRRVDIAGISVRLAGYRLQHEGTVDVIARNRRVTLLALSPEQSEDTAERLLAAAAGDGNTDDVDALLKNEDRS